MLFYAFMCVRTAFFHENSYFITIPRIEVENYMCGIICGRDEGSKKNDLILI